MHWFWRAVIAVTVTLASWPVLDSLDHAPSVQRVAFRPDGTVIGLLPPPLVERTIRFGLDRLFPLVLCLAIYGVLTRTLGPRVLSDGHIRCRKCHYILRGITEPRCPECGEGI